MRRGVSGAAGEEGFTLAELLVALAITGLIAVMMSSALGFGARIWERGASSSDTVDDVRATQSFLRNTIGAIYPLSLGDDLKAEAQVFEGTSSRMRFAGPALPQMGHAGLTRYELRRDRNDHLALRWCPLDSCLDNADFLNARDSAVVHESIDRVAFRYGVRDGLGQVDWSGTWTDPDLLPELVEVSIQYGNDDPRAWPVLVVRIYTEKDVRCVFDPVSKSCRGRG